LKWVTPHSRELAIHQFDNHHQLVAVRTVTAYSQFLAHEPTLGTAAFAQQTLLTAGAAVHDVLQQDLLLLDVDGYGRQERLLVGLLSEAIGALSASPVAIAAATRRLTTADHTRSRGQLLPGRSGRRKL